MPITSEQMVKRAIRNFSESRPQTHVGTAAIRMLLDHARKHRKETLANLRAGTVTERKLVRSLEEVLAHAENLERRHRVGNIYAERSRAYKRTERSRAYNRKIGKRFSYTHGPGYSLLSKDAIKKAMGKKCETFPWC